MRARTVLVACAVIMAVGCEFMPGTEAYQIEQAKRSVAKLLIDPESVQFQNVVARQGYVCGELNGRNRMGAFVGFKRFLVKLDGEDPIIDPQFDYADLLSAEDSCSALQSNSYASISTRISACDRAMEQRRAATLQEAFDASWTKHCGIPAASSIYRPPLGDTQSDNAVVPVADQLPQTGTADMKPDDEGVDGPLVDENGLPVKSAAPTPPQSTGNEDASTTVNGSGETSQQ